MNTTHTHSTLNAAAELGCRIQIWHLREGATSSADGQWDDADGVPTFECPAHLYRVHPSDEHLLNVGGEQVQVESENARMRVDAERYRWIRVSADVSWNGWVAYSNLSATEAQRAEMDTAIDGAIGKVARHG